MSSLTLITGTIDEAEDPFLKLNLSELYYEKWEEDEDDVGAVVVSREPVPIRFYGGDKFRLTQYLGSGKTLKGMDILAQKVVYGGRVAANLGLVWHNEGKPKEDWTSTIQTLDDFRTVEHCTALLDDIKGTVARWNVKESDIVGEVANAGRKMGLDLIVTAQREKMIPPELRDIATEWIVPIIRVRDFTRHTPDNTGYPLEMISLHFDGSKTFKFMSNPLIGLETLFEAYSTTQRAVCLKIGEGSGARPNQPGYKLEAELFDYLNIRKPEMGWVHLNGKGVFDIISDNDQYAFDVVGIGEDGRCHLDHKDLTEHIRQARAKGHLAYLVMKSDQDWAFIPITYPLNDQVKGKKIPLKRLNQSIRRFDAVFS